MRFLRIALLVSLALALVVPAAAQAAQYHGRAAGNNPNGNGLIGKHRFVTGDSYAVQFRDSERSNTRYRVCAFMGGKRKGCTTSHTRGRDRWATVTSDRVWQPDRLGRIVYRWYVDGKRVAAWSVRFEMESE
jgi:hypothetical protein